MNRIIPVVTLNSVEERTKVLSALKKKGILCAEICFRTDCAEEAIKLSVPEFPDMEIGAGTIIIADRRISGLTTAASLWCAACLGLAVGAGFTTMALVACLVVMIVLKLMQRIVHVHTYKRLEIQFIHRNETLKYIRDTFDQMEVKILDQDFHADNTQDGQNIYTNVYTLSMHGKTQYQDLITVFSEYPNIRTVRTRNV